MSTTRKRRKGVGSLIGAIFVLLILVSGYSLFLFNAKSQTEYQNILTEMHQRDLEQSQEYIEFKRVTTNEDNKLQMTVKNHGSHTSHLLFIGVFDKTAVPENQTYFNADIYIGSTETVIYDSPSIMFQDGHTYEIQIVSSFGNVFSSEYTPGYEVFSDTVISTIAGGLWETDFQPSSYNIESGSYVSGVWPGAINVIDSDYIITEGVYAAGGTDTYYPNAYTMVNSTTYLSGGIGSLSANDGVGMTFRGYPGFNQIQFYPTGTAPITPTTWISGVASSLAYDNSSYVTYSSYVSSTSTTTPSTAYVAYRSNSLSGDAYPKYAEFNGTWSTPVELVDAGNELQGVRSASCPIEARYYEKIVAVVDDDSDLDVYVYNGTTWLHSNFGDMDGRDQRPFDVAYETTRGNAMLVYGTKVMGAGRDLAYRVWDGSSWSTEQYMNDPSENDNSLEYRYVNLASNPVSGSNQLAFIGIDSDNWDACAAIWNGNAWVSWQEISTNVPRIDRECVAVAYEYTSGNILAVAGNGNRVYWSRYNGAWSAPANFDINSGSTTVMMWLTLKSHLVAGSNRIMLLSLDDARDACARDWNSAWGTSVRLDNDMEADDAMCFDGDWELTGTTFVAFGGNRNTNSLSYKSWTPSGWDIGYNSWNTYSGLTREQRWVKVRTDPRGVGNVKMLIATIDDDRDLVISTWDGSAITYQSELTTDVGVTNRDVLDIEYNLFGDPDQDTAEVEISGSSNTESLSQLSWTVDSAVSQAEANVTFQLYDYDLDDYPSSGDGYLEYTSSITPGQEELKSQDITVNPNYFKDAGGNWKIKATLVKDTATQFDYNLDFVELEPTILVQSCSVEIKGSSNSDPWLSLDWLIDTAWNQSDVNTKLQLYDYYVDAYPESGDGYIEYTSSSTPDTDELKSQTIASAPYKFRDPSGNWVIRVTGEKNTLNPIELSVDFGSYTSIGGSYSVATEYTFTNVPMVSLQGLRYMIVSDHNETLVGVSMQAWNYLTVQYDTVGEGTTAYTSTSGNETEWVNVTSGVTNYVSGGKARIRLTSQYSGAFTQNVNYVRLDYSHVPPTLPYDTWQTYIIQVMDSTSGDPRPFVGLTVYTDGSASMFDGIPNPSYITVDSNGRYTLRIKSTNVAGETFKLHVILGSVASEKNIIQTPWGV